MSIGEGVALAGLILTVLTMLGGATWWMASLYSLVRKIADDLHNVIASNVVEHARIWEAMSKKVDKE